MLLPATTGFFDDGGGGRRGPTRVASVLTLAGFLFSPDLQQLQCISLELTVIYNDHVLAPNTK